MDYILDKKSQIILPNLEGIIPSKSSYLTTDIFTNYFDKTVLDAVAYNKNLVCNTKSNTLSNYFVKIDFVEFQYKIPTSFLKSLQQCQVNNTRFYVILLVLVLDYKSSHSNVIIIDNLTKTIELFEPHGKKYSAPTPYDIEYHIKNLLFNIFPYSSKSYIFKNVQSSCPIGVQGLQNIINPESGHCLAWSLLFIQIKIHNLSISTDTIIDFLLKIQDIDLYMRKFIGFLELYTMFTPKKQTDLKYQIKLLPNELSNVKNRITHLIYLYKNNTTIDKEKVFQELISYHKLGDFDKLFFKDFNENTLITQNKKRKI